jgi:hypothetical protein
MSPLVINKIANYLIHALTKKILIAQHLVDYLRDLPKPIRFLLMLSMQIANFRSCSGVARFKLLERSHPPLDGDKNPDSP